MATCWSPHGRFIYRALLPTFGTLERLNKISKSPYSILSLALPSRVLAVGRLSSKIVTASLIFEQRQLNGRSISYWKTSHQRRRDRGISRADKVQFMSRLYPKATRSEEGMASIARVYADVNDTKPQEYWDYENYNIEWGYVCIYAFRCAVFRQISSCFYFIWLQRPGQVRGDQKGRQRKVQ